MPNLRHPETGQETRASHATAERLLADGWELLTRSVNDAAETPAEASKSDGATIDQLNGKQLDEAAEKLSVDGWNHKAKVDAKRDALKEAVAARLAEHDIEGLTYESPVDDLIAAITATSDQ